MSGSKKKKNKGKPFKIKVDPMAGRPRPKPINLHGPAEKLTHAREYPLVGCWVMKDWQGAGLTPVVVARQQPDERILYAVILVDLFLLGVKNAYWRVDERPVRFYKQLDVIMQGEPEKVEPELAHEIVYGSIEYAHRYEFEPHLDYKETSRVLEPEGTYPRKGKVEFGKDGKPFYVSGPNDNVPNIMAKLRRTAGDGNFDFLSMIPGEEGE